MVICTNQNQSERMRRINSLGLTNTNISSNLGQTSRPSDSQQKQENQPNSGLCSSG